jgi:hypothetical protein
MEKKSKGKKIKDFFINLRKKSNFNEKIQQILKILKVQKISKRPANERNFPLELRKSIKNYFPKKLPHRFYSRIGALLSYSIGLAHIFCYFGRPIAYKYPIIAKILAKMPIFYLYKKYYNRHLLLIIVLISHKLFLKRKEVGDFVIIDTPYFLKHHIYHTLLLLINFSLPETFLVEFFPPKRKLERTQFCLNFLIFNAVCFVPCMINAFRGKYNNLPFISDAVLYWIGDCPNPEEEDSPYLKNVPWIQTSYWKGGRYGKKGRGIEEEEDDDDDNDE